MQFMPLLLILVLLAACSSDNPSTPPPIQLPQTGQVTSFKTGDDGYYQKGVPWPSPRFTDNTDGTVTDRLTGLVWLKDATCIGKKGWGDALAASNSLAAGACGLSDGSKAGTWRLPNINELNSLVNVGRWNPALGPMPTAGGSSDTPFTLAANAWYWSSTSSSAITTQAWAVHFLFGLTNPYFKKSAFTVWPVRDGAVAGAVKLASTGQTVSHAAGDDGAYRKGAVWPNPRFTDNANGTVTDNLTRLVWLKDTNCLDTVGGIKRIISDRYSVLFYNQALLWTGGLAAGACGLNDGSKAGDWRLPNRLELQSLLDYGQHKPALPSGHPFANVQINGAFTSTLMNYSATTFGVDAAWFIYPGSGIANTATIKITGTSLPIPVDYYIWAVRDATP